MPRYFPRETVAWHLEEPRVLRKLTLSLPVMALIAGLLVRLVRVGVSGLSVSWWGVFGAIALGLVILLTMATAHLGNYPVKQWLWRAPLFGLAEGVAGGVGGSGPTGVGVWRLGRAPSHPRG